MDNRSNILDQALELFAQRGYEAVGVAEIVAAAGVTKPTLYHYFGSKQGLLQVLVQERFQDMWAQVRPAAEYQGDLPLTLYRVAEAYFGFARQQPQFYRLLLAMWFSPQESPAFQTLLPLGRRQQDLLEELFSAASRDHGNMKGRHRRYAATFLGMINTWIGLALHGYADLDQETTFQSVHQFMHGIYS